MKKYLKAKFSLFDTFCLILKIKQMSPLGFGTGWICRNHIAKIFDGVRSKMKSASPI